MADLISRSVLCDMLEDMLVSDSDLTLGEYTLIVDIIEKIKCIPTAYDVEAVVAELEKYMDDARMWDEDDFYDGKARAYECAISIVRGKE